MLQLDIKKAYDIIDWYALENILTELGFPNKFTRWVMVVVSTISNRFNIGGVCNAREAKEWLHVTP